MQKLMHALFSFVTLTCLQETHGARIMFFTAVSSYSHQISMWPLAQALADRGHEVTFVTPFHSKVPVGNVTYFVPKSLHDWVHSWDLSNAVFTDRQQGVKVYYDFPMYGVAMCNILLKDPEFMEFIRHNSFDLIIQDAQQCECLYGVAFLHKARTIAFGTAITYPWYVDTMGIPDESSWLPDVIVGGSPETQGFFKRIISLFHPLLFNLYRELWTFPQLDSIIKETLAPDFPSVSSMERNLSLMFVNQRVASDYPRPFPPNVIPIGCLQCTENFTSPSFSVSEELQNFLNTVGEEEGFIYMSFGSFVEISAFPAEKRNVFINTLKSMGSKGVKFVWKINVDRPDDLPSSVFTSRWVPQQALLAHPKIRGFITHAGMLGMQEAIFHGVPLILFPMFCEQDYNADKMAWRRVAFKMEVLTVTEDTFETAIESILTDKMYTKNMKRLSSLFRDQPTKPLDDAVFWTEYVLRHGEDANTILRPLSTYQSWWRKRQLDIWFCIFFVLLCIVKVLLLLGTKVFKIFLVSKGKVKQKAL